MCGLITQRISPVDLQKTLNLFLEPAWNPSYLVRPTQPLLAVRAAPGGWRADPLRWQLVPPWKRQISNSDNTWNAMGETVAEKPTFRNAFRSQRCLIPTAGFFEWEKIPIHKTRTYRQPWLIHSATPGLLVMAGLWERWQGVDGTCLESCTVITTTPNNFMQPLHHRMPVILQPTDWAIWLDSASSPATLQDLLRPCPDAWLDRYRVAADALKDSDSPACLEPLQSPPDLGPRQMSLF